MRHSSQQTSVKNRINTDPGEGEFKINQKAHKEEWQVGLSEAVTDPKKLIEHLQLDESIFTEEMGHAALDFRVFVTHSFLNRIQKRTLDDPLLKQILPSPKEIDSSEQYQIDPLQEKQSNVVPGLLHKYHGRALLICNGHCAINCRFCFRRNFSYGSNHYSGQNKAAIHAYLEDTPTIEELILSGGDPLLMNDRKLQEIIGLVESIPHIQRLRIHSRTPIVLPSRVTEKLGDMLRNSRLQTIMVVHCNHAQEINQEVADALQVLKQCCDALLNQSVLLKSVNDTPEAQIALNQCLFKHHVQPYYLHILDKIKGAAHFDMALSEAQTLYHEMEAKLPGYMLPKLVQEQAGELNKVQVSCPRGVGKMGSE